MEVQEKDETSGSTQNEEEISKANGKSTGNEDTETKDSLEELLNESVKNCPGCELLWLIYAKEVWSTGDIVKARSVLEEGYRLNMNSENIFLAAVKLEWKNDEFERTRILLKKARTFAKSPKVYRKSIMLERQLGHIENEEELIHEAIKEYPKHYKFYVIAGEFYEIVKLNSIDKMVQKDEENNEKAKDEIKKEKKQCLDKARQLYKKGYTECKECSVLYIIAAQLEEKYNKKTGTTKGRCILEQGRVANTKHPELWLASVRYERLVGNLKGAEMLLAKGLQENPDSGLLMSENILMANKAQRKRLSLQALQKKDNDIYVCCVIGRVFYEDNKIAKSIKWLERVVTLNPLYGDGWGWYIYVLQQSKKFEQAKEIKERCKNAEPKEGEMWKKAKKHLRTCMKTQKNEEEEKEDIIEYVLQEIEKLDKQSTSWRMNLNASENDK